MNDIREFCVFAERQVGIGAAAGALEPYVRARGDVEWVDVTYRRDGGLIEALPLPTRVGGTLRGFLQTGAGLRRGPYKAQLFLTHNPAVFRNGALRRTPTILWTDVTPALLDAQAEQYDHAVSTGRVVAALKRHAVRRTFHAARACLGWSDWARRSFVADYGVPEAHTATLAPGVELGARLVRVPGTGLPRLLFVGGDFRRKGGDLLLEVFRAALRQRCELDLVTRDAVDPEPGVRVYRGLAPKDSKLADLYRDASALVLPTRGDCFSIAALEAMASSLPVVISDVGGIREIVENGKSGFLVPPSDAIALRSAVETLLGDSGRARAMGEHGRLLAENRYDAAKVAERLVERLREIAAS